MKPNKIEDQNKMGKKMFLKITKWTFFACNLVIETNLHRQSCNIDTKVQHKVETIMTFTIQKLKVKHSNPQNLSTKLEVTFPQNILKNEIKIIDSG